MFGLAILEAFSRAKPVVAANIGAIPEIVENDKSGFLYAPGDSNDLSRKIRRMFENPEIANSMGRYALHIVSLRFSPKKYWEQLENLHRELLQPPLYR